MQTKIEKNNIQQQNSEQTPQTDSKANQKENVSPSELEKNTQISTDEQLDSNSSSQAQRPWILSFLQSDTTLYIAIVLAFLGMIGMLIFAYLLQGMARVHLSVVAFLFFGLTLSLLFFKHLKSLPGPQNTLQSSKTQ